VRRLRIAIIAAAVLWPLGLGTAVAARHAGEGLWSTAVYVAAGRLCHQRPARSFATASTVWPVCARCSGLYLAAPLGAVLGWGRARDPRRPRLGSRGRGGLLLVAAIPTVVTIGLEWLNLVPVSNLARAIAALPLGAAIAWAIVEVLGEPAGSIRYTDRR
jgi:hypothetical protein